MLSGYSQHGYQNCHPSNWGPSDAPPMQQPGYGYMQPGAYPGPLPQYMSQPPYSGYAQPASSGYPSNWDQSSASTNQQKSQGYDYYSQPPPQQPLAAAGSAAPADNTGYNYGQPPAASYGQQGQGYVQGGYGGYYQSGYGQAPQYDQQQGYNSASTYGNVGNTGQERQTPPSYGAQGETTQGLPPPSTGQRGYVTGQQPGPNMGSYPSAPASQSVYGMPPTSQAAYGNQLHAQPGYGLPQAQKLSANPPVYEQTQQSPNAGYGQTAPIQPGYPHTQPPQTGYTQPESGSQRTPPSSYGALTAAVQPGYGPPYGAPPVSQTAYGGQAPPPYNTAYGGACSQPAAYPADGNSGANGGARGAYDTVQATRSVQQTVAKASPRS